MYEKESKEDEILSMLRILDTKINMIMSDTEQIQQLQETLTQLKFFVETAEENRIEEASAKKKAGRWKREVL